MNKARVAEAARGVIQFETSRDIEINEVDIVDSLRIRNGQMIVVPKPI